MGMTRVVGFSTGAAVGDRIEGGAVVGLADRTIVVGDATGLAVGALYRMDMLMLMLLPHWLLLYPSNSRKALCKSVSVTVSLVMVNFWRRRALVISMDFSVRSSPIVAPWVNAEEKSKHVVTTIVWMMFIMIDFFVWLFWLCLVFFLLELFLNCENNNVLTNLWFSLESCPCPKSSLSSSVIVGSCLWSDFIGTVPFCHGWFVPLVRYCHLLVRAALTYGT